VFIQRAEAFHEDMMKVLGGVLMAGVFIAVLISVVFSYFYPLVTISKNLFLLFTLVGIIIALIGKGIWQISRKDKNSNPPSET
jgi:high-affinity Fe2+/Pb2+ permease